MTHADRLHEFLNQLQGYLDEARQSRDASKGFQKMKRWRERVLAFVEDEFGQAEARRFEEAGRVPLSYLGSGQTNLETKIHAYSAYLEALIEDLKTGAVPVASNHQSSSQDSPRTADVTPVAKVFISHSSQDVDVATAIVALLKAALSLRPKDIICTSVPGHKLKGGAAVGAKLREQVVASDALVALITDHGMESAYVLFELGARWGSTKDETMLPLLQRAKDKHLLAGPLMDIQALSCDLEDEVLQFVVDLADVLKRNPNPANSYIGEVRALVTCASQT